MPTCRLDLVESALLMAHALAGAAQRGMVRRVVDKLGLLDLGRLDVVGIVGCIPLGSYLQTLQASMPCIQCLGMHWYIYAL